MATSQHGPAGAQPLRKVGRWVWVAMMIGIVVEFAAGVIALVLVPVDRPSGWLPAQGELAYGIHAVVGAVLTLAALGLVWVAPRGRRGRAGVLVGLAGLVVAAGGGMLAAYHPARFIGLLLMLAGSLVAFFSYLVPLAEPEPDGSAVAPNGQRPPHLEG